MPLKVSPSLKEIAIAAKDYARKYIKKGFTQLENNKLSEVSQLALEAGVRDLRDETNTISTSRDENKYEAKINSIQKYSLGNCGEMADLALYYVLTHHPDIFAQVYEIFNGDHEVLVIEKGAETFISDPYSNKVYPFSELKNQLKNYLYSSTALSKETLELQENKLKELEEKGLHVKDRNSEQLTLIDSQKNEIGKTYFFKFRDINHACLLNSDQVLIPIKGNDVLSFYRQGATYRRAKIKDVLDLLELFKDIFPLQIYNLQRLLSGERLLQDDCLQALLTLSQLESRKDAIETGLMDLKNIKRSLQFAVLIQKETNLRSKFSFLLKQSSHSELLKKITLVEKFYPLPEQLNKVSDAIDCLNQLLEGRPANCTSNKWIKDRKLNKSILLPDDTDLFNADNYICENFIKGYRPIKNFSTELDHYCKQFSDTLSISKDYSNEDKQKINQLISDLQKIVGKYLKLPTPMESKALLLALHDAKEILSLFDFPSQNSFISSINKLISQLDSFEKGAAIPQPRKMDGISNNVKIPQGNLYVLFQPTATVQANCLPKPLFAAKIYSKP